MTYESIITGLKDVKLTMGGMIRLQRAVGPKAAVLNKSEKDIKAMTAEQSAEHQLAMMEVLSTLIHVALGSPEDITPDGVADLIPFDQIEEVSTLIGGLMGSVEKTRKKLDSGADYGMMIEATALYNCGKLFGYTPQQTRDLTCEEYAFLMWSSDEDTKRQNEAQSGKGPKHNPKGGSSVDGEKISSVSQLMSMANKK